ncbi:MAG TPA: TlpA disulfide reductase family protein [Candidatus Acidoferrales bacterium]|jgi:peroxiredoxin|nr:TlpA disulfide reductase family protein [Candidatus Acidoferrales bacterium]
MTKVQVGNAAPAFALSGMNGKQYSLGEALKKGPVLAAFFKIHCPVCQFTFPFLERLYETYGGDKIAIWGISQDDAADTKEFCDEYGVKFTTLIDGDGYPVSNQYALTNVPTVLLIGSDGKVTASCVGFSKPDLEKMAAELARASGKPAQPLFRPGEVVPDYKPG